MPEQKLQDTLQIGNPTDLTSLSSAVSDLIKLKQQRIHDQQHSINRLMTDKNTLKYDIKNLEVQLEVEKEDNERLRQERNDAEDDRDKYKNERDEFLEYNKELYEQKEGNKEELLKSESKLFQAELELQNLRGIKRKYEKLKPYSDACKRKYEEYKGKFIESDEKRKKLEEDLKEQQNELRSIRREKDDSKADNKILQDELYSLQEQKNKLNQELLLLRDENHKLRNTISSLKGEVNTLKKQQEQLQKDYDDSQKEIAKLNGEKFDLVQNLGEREDYRKKFENLEENYKLLYDEYNKLKSGVKEKDSRLDFVDSTTNSFSSLFDGCVPVDCMNYNI